MRHLLPALVLGLLVPLSACSNEPEPQFADPTSDAPSSSTPTTEPVVDPPTSDPAVHESARTFIRRFGDLEQEMQNSGDSGPYREVTRDCVGCTNLADLVDRYYGNGGSITWDGWDVEEISVYDKARGAYLVKVNSAPTTYRRSSSADQERLPGGPSSYVLVLRREGSSWVVREKNELLAS